MKNKILIIILVTTRFATFLIFVGCISACLLCFSYFVNKLDICKCLISVFLTLALTYIGITINNFLEDKLEDLHDEYWRI